MRSHTLSEPCRVASGLQLHGRHRSCHVASSRPQPHGASTAVALYINRGTSTVSAIPPRALYTLGVPRHAPRLAAAVCRTRGAGRVWCRAGGSSVEGAEEEEVRALTDWDLKGLKKEVDRQVVRQFKKVAKANERFRKEDAKVEEVLAMENPPLEALESLGDMDGIQRAQKEAQERLGDLNRLQEGLQSVKSTAAPEFQTLAALALTLKVSDSPPPKQTRGPKKAKGQKPAPRQPFVGYSSADGLQVRVGRGSADNDELSCDPRYRDGADWWLHVAGHPGSHVVVRSHRDDLPSACPETLKDAAVLAAKYSKGPQRGKSTVHYVRCRQVSKPSGAKPGLVRLNGDVGTITVNVQTEAARLERLEGTVEPLNKARM